MCKLSKLSKTIIVLVMGVFLFGGMGCASTGAGKQISLAKQAEKDYREGMEDLIGGNYTEAILAFERVAKAPRYIRWSSLAKLRIGDSLYFSGKHREAAQYYEDFIRQYRGDPNMAHAQFWLAKSHYARIPSDMWILPPPYERDRTALKESRRALEVFVAEYNRSRFYGEARSMLEQVMDLQYGFVSYVVGYYQRKEEPGAVVVRLENALSAFPTRSRENKVRLQLAKAYLERDRIRDGLNTYRIFLKMHPEAKEVSQVKEWVSELEAIVKTKADPEVGNPQNTGDGPAE